MSNDSEMFLPPGMTARAMRPEDCAPYVQALRSSGSDIPGCDGPEPESPLLEPFQGPLASILRGRFTEVRSLHGSIPFSDLAIVSARYGLVDAGQPAFPYHCPIEGKEAVSSLYMRFGIIESLMRMHDQYDVMLIFLPRAHVEVIAEQWQGDMEGMLFVTSESLFEELRSRGAIVLPRRGARVGGHNKQAIMDELERRGWCGRRDLNPSSKLGKLK